MRRFLISLFLFLAFGCSDPSSEKEGIEYRFNNGEHQLNYEALFTSGLDENNRPIDNIKEISMEEKVVYFYIAWAGLRNREYRIKNKIYDGSGDLVFSYSDSYRPYADGLLNTPIWYSFNKFVDTPGYWRFEVYVDNKAIFEKPLEVLPAG